MAVPCKLEEPKTLKDSLQFFGKLSEVPVLRSLVLNSLENSLAEFFHKTILSTFTSNSYGEILQTLLSANDVLNNIYPNNTADAIKYGQYSGLDSSEPDECVQSITKYMTAMLPKVYCTLYFLYYNTSPNDNEVGGGDWKGYKIKENNGLYQWLIGQRDPTPGLLPGGFSVELKSSTATGQILGSILERAFGVKSRGKFQNAMLAMLFLGEWHNAKTAHGCLFIKAFCEKVQTNTFQHTINESRVKGTYENFKQICQSLKDNLDDLIQFDVISPVYYECGSLYSSYIDQSRFPKYITWLQANLDELKKSLKEMQGDCSNWDKTNLQAAKSSGPFRYGFVFKTLWDVTTLKDTLSTLIDNLTKESGVGLDTGSETTPLDKLKGFLAGVKAEDFKVKEDDTHVQNEQTREPVVKSEEPGSSPGTTMPSTPEAQKSTVKSPVTETIVTDELDPCALCPPTTLKSCLQLLAKLHKLPTLRSRLFGVLRDRLKDYCLTHSGTTYLSNLIDGDYGYLAATLKHAYYLLYYVLSSTDNVAIFGCYKDLTESSECVDKLIDYILLCLPNVYCTLYFLYFNVCSECNSIRGGKWSNQRLKPSVNTNKELHDWLTGQISTTHLMAGGFQSAELHQSTTASVPAMKLKDSLHHQNAAALQSAMVGMVFLCPWNSGLTGHALLFLDYFCTTVQVATALEPRYQALRLIGTFDTFKSACAKVKASLGPFINGSSGLLAVCQGNTRLYSTLWDPEAFSRYIKWLWDNILKIIEALTQMGRDCGILNEGSLKAGSTAGPFAYGLVFKVGWNETYLKNQLSTLVTSLNGSLHCLDIVIRHHSLKDTLQCFGRLHKLRALKQKISMELKNRMESYACSTYLEKLGETDGPIFWIFQTADWVLNGLLMRPNYGQYNDLEECSTECCLITLTNNVVAMVTQVYPVLYFLYYQVSLECRSIKGGGWSRMQVSGMSDSSQNYLNLWLTDATVSIPGLMAIGFQGEVLCNPSTGQNLAHQLKDLLSHEQTKTLQTVLFCMLFLCPWHHSKLGHASLFIKVLCDKVESFKEHYEALKLSGSFESFKSTCNTLKEELSKLVNGSTTKIQAVCQQYNDKLYGTVWDVSKIKGYITWLKDNIPQIKTSLEQMEKDCSNWNEGALQSATTIGPFKYGFVFSKSWDGKSETIQSALKSAITGVMESLPKLLKELVNEAKKDIGDIGARKETSSKTEDVPLVLTREVSSEFSVDVPITTSYKALESSCSFRPPTTLLESLQLLNKLHTLPKLKTSLATILQSQMGSFCSADYLSKLSLEDSSYSEVNARFSKTQQDAEFLLAFMMGRNKDYGPYACLQDSASSAEEYAEVVIALFPKIHSVLYYLYFNVKNKLSSIGGGAWASVGLSDSAYDFNKWLTDKKTGSSLMFRGFQGKVNPTYGLTGAAIASQIDPLLNKEDGGSLQNILVPLLFLGPWHESKLGHAILFLKALCDNISISQDYSNDDQGAPDDVDDDATEPTEEEEEDPDDVDFGPVFKERYPGFSYYAFQYKCAAVSTAIEPFTESAEFLCAVCEDGSTLYENLLKRDSLELYIEWLEGNLNGINASLQSMSKDTLSWNIEDIQVGECDGPFPYGFVFVGDPRQTGIKGPVPSQIVELIRSLNAMVEFFHQGSQLSTIVGTVGGTVVGAAGLGAAYAYNLWGFATLVQSVLAPLL